MKQNIKTCFVCVSPIVTPLTISFNLLLALNLINNITCFTHEINVICKHFCNKFSRIWKPFLHQELEEYYRERVTFVYRKRDTSPSAFYQMFIQKYLAWNLMFRLLFSGSSDFISIKRLLSQLNIECWYYWTLVFPFYIEDSDAEFHADMQSYKSLLWKLAETKLLTFKII